MQSLTIDSNQITLPHEVFIRLKGKSVQFVEIPDGFIMKSVSQNSKAEYKFEELLADISDNESEKIPLKRGSGKEIITYMAEYFDKPLEDFREYME